MQYRATGFYKNLDNDSLPKPVAEITSTEPIEQTRYEAVKKAKDICFLALGLEEKFQLVLDNFKEWETELFSQAQSYLLWRATTFDATQQRLSLDRRLTNVLTTFRLYLDQTDYAVSETFGNPSAQLEAIKKFKHGLYDNYFGYRFLEELRNHVQHCGLPVQMIRFGERLAERKEGDQIEFTITPKFTLDYLEGGDKFKKSILEEVKSRGGKIDLRKPTREYISCLVRLHGELRKTFSEIVSSSRSFYFEAVKEYSLIGGFALQFPRLQCVDDSGAVKEQIDLITDFLNVYDTLHKRNSNVKDITMSFASNAL